MKNLKYISILLLCLASLSSCVIHTKRSAKKKNTKVVKIVPAKSKVIFVNGKKYYKWNNKYHRKTKKGFVVVRL
jgi:hypothetical protein